MIAEAVLAIEYEASAEDIARTSHAHPTSTSSTRPLSKLILIFSSLSVSEAVKEAAMAAYDKREFIPLLPVMLDTDLLGFSDQLLIGL